LKKRPAYTFDWREKMNELLVGTGFLLAMGGLLFCACYIANEVMFPYRPMTRAQRRKMLERRFSAKIRNRRK
jgi:hypothetical protein